MNHTFHAVHYSASRPPVLFRFTTAADREAWIADHPSFRRAIAAPADQSGYLAGPVTVAGAQVSAGFRVAGLDDRFSPVTELRDRMIDRLKGAAVSPLSREFDKQVEGIMQEVAAGQGITLIPSGTPMVSAGLTKWERRHLLPSRSEEDAP